MQSPSPFFKGWAKPGPLPPFVDLLSRDDVSLDAISGHFRIYQLKRGHRFSTDDILAAWYGTSWCPSARTVLDLGSGIGTLGMIAAWRLQGARFVTVEAQEESVALARASARYNGLEDRYEIRNADLRSPEALRDDEKFDLILGSPPYFPPDAGIHGDHPQKVACRFELRGGVEDYCAVAAKHLELGGVFACVFPINPKAQEERVQKGAEAAGLSIVRMRPVVLREGEEPLLGLFVLMRSSDLPEGFRDKTWREPALVIRAASGEVHPEYAAVKLSIGFPP